MQLGTLMINSVSATPVCVYTNKNKRSALPTNYSKSLPVTSSFTSVKPFKQSNVFNNLDFFRLIAFGKKIVQNASNIIVLDAFNRKEIDIDGDGIDDVSHGRVITGIIRSILPDAHVEILRAKTDPESFQFV